MSVDRKTLCIACATERENKGEELEIIGTAAYTATGYCQDCNKRTSVKRYFVFCYGAKKEK